MINVRPSAAGLPTAPSRETEASVDARRVMRNGRPRGRWQTGRDQHVLMKLVDLHTPQRPHLMLHRNGNQAASDAGEGPPPSGEEVVTRVDLSSGQRRPGSTTISWPAVGGQRRRDR